MIKGVIFDMDGVLADTEYFYQKRRNAFLEEKHFAYPKDLDFVGSNEQAIWNTLVPDNPELRQKMLLEYREYRASHPEPYEELADPQVVGLFEELKFRGLKIGIASSSEMASIEALMAATGVTELVDYYISGLTCHAHKPDPEIYLRALKALELTAETAFAVEDSSTGIAAALNAGMRVYALKPRHGENLDQSAATAVINQLSDVLKILA